ncbi:MAG: MBL fold metallo-hydrolase [Nitrospirae bacterium]|nr:MBL fold metallo-hydrolase [Nitrospirota bacterium]
MKVYFWGSRGSLPSSVTYSAVKEKVRKALQAARGLDLSTDEKIDRFIDDFLPFSIKGTYGCNTPCVELRYGDHSGQYVICDAGTGLRDLGTHIIEHGKPGSANSPAVFHVFLSHLHWDHIQGFPFFTPAYLPGNVIHFYGFHKEMEQVFYSQQEYPNFPVSLKNMQSQKSFTLLEPGKVYEIAGLSVFGMRQKHPGDAYGLSFTADGKKVVYSTDSEHKKESQCKGYPLIKLYQNADLLIFDAQYSFAEAIYVKEDWGHSSNLMGVELSVRSGVKHLCMFHNEPTKNDATLEKMLDETKEYVEIFSPGYQLKIDIAYDGLELEV